MRLFGWIIKIRRDESPSGKTKRLYKKRRKLGICVLCLKPTIKKDNGKFYSYCLTCRLASSKQYVRGKLTKKL